MSGLIVAGLASLGREVLFVRLMVCASVLGRYGRGAVLALVGSSCNGARSALVVLMGEMKGL